MVFDINRSFERADYSTINLTALRRLPVYNLPPTYHLSGFGAACAGDAPGFPTYFLRGVYTQSGNNPPYRQKNPAPDHVITDPEDANKHYRIPNSWDFSSKEKMDSGVFHRLWVPLPIDHPRVWLWMQATYVHMAHCYNDPTEREYGRDGTLIWPIPDYEIINHVGAPPRAYDGITHEEVESVFLPAWKYKEQEYVASKRYLATPENHLAVRAIQRFYPDHEPIVEWIENPPLDGYEPNNRFWEACSSSL